MSKDYFGPPGEGEVLVFGRGWRVPFSSNPVLIGPFASSTTRLRLRATAACYIEFGDANVVAVSPAWSPPVVGSHYISANTDVYLQKGGPDKGVEYDYLSVKLETTSGTLYVSEMC